MKTLAVNLHEEDDSDSFAERAENYYRKRPQLLNLLQDLYNGYLSLADRYCQTVIKQYRAASSSSSQSISALNFDVDDHGWTHFDSQQNDSDAESSLSYQAPTTSLTQQQQQQHELQEQNALDSDALVAQLVIKTVEYEFVAHELATLERCNSESSRKMDLQKSLLEVLESERLVLLGENARLGYSVNALTDENKGLTREVMLMKRKAGDLARCVLKMRADHRVCLLVRRIEDLQCQVYGLEKKNREYSEQLMEKKTEESECMEKNHASDGAAVTEKSKMGSNRWVKAETIFSKKASKTDSNKKWWGKVKKMDLFFLCGPNSNQQVQ
ncbi:hypothetical protein Scep_016001 [Stephania cephalantha]|uniref:NAB domain-containing protein n=1 Tax=Stephania cephalantha TaxID=152367 RepID=A0AAP0NST3_9MAGN